MGSHEKDAASPRRAPAHSGSAVSSRHSSLQQGSESWELVEEPRAQGSPGREPQRHEGYLLKKRKWPLKGWHKRYFVLERGTLQYATTRQDVLKGKLHGSIDVRLSVVSVNKKAQRVDLDTGHNIYHLKVKSPELFSSWVSSLCSHHQHERPEPPAGPTGGPGGQPPATTQGSRSRIVPSGSAPALSALASPRDEVAPWLEDSEALERCSAELGECQAKLRELSDMLQSLESLHRIPSAPLISSSQPPERPKKGRRSTRIWCTQSFAKDDTMGRVGRLHGSVPNLSRSLEPGGSLPAEYWRLQRSFWSAAQRVHGSLGSVVAALTAERARLERLRRALDGRRGAPCPGGSGTERRDGLRRFHSLSVSSDTTLESFASLQPGEAEALPDKGREQQLSNRSIGSLADSHAEFFDACEVFLSASSSGNEASDDESCVSEATNSIEDVAEAAGVPRGTGRRRRAVDKGHGRETRGAGWVLGQPGAGVLTRRVGRSRGAGGGGAAGAAGAGRPAAELPAGAAGARGRREPLEHPAQQRGQGPVQGVHAGAAQRAAQHAAAPLRGARVQRAAGPRQPLRRPPRAHGVRGGLRRVRLRLELPPRGLQALQPGAGRDLRVRAARARLPLRQRAGLPPPARVRLPRRVRQLRLLAGHEVEEQILGQIPGDRARGHGECAAAQVRRPLRVEQGDDVHPQRAERAALGGALRRGAHPQRARRRAPLPPHLPQGAVLGRGRQRGAGRGAERRGGRRGAAPRHVARGALPWPRAGRPLRLESQPHAAWARAQLRLHAVRPGAQRADARAQAGAAPHRHPPAPGPAVPGGGQRAGGRGAQAADRAAAAGPAPRHGAEQHRAPGALLQAAHGRQRQRVLGHQQHVLEAAPGPRLRAPRQRRALVAGGGGGGAAAEAAPLGAAVTPPPHLPPSAPAPSARCPPAGQPPHPCPTP